MGVTYRSTPTFEPRPWSEVKTGYTHFADGDVLLARITPSFENGKAGIVSGLPNGIGAGSTEYFVCRPRQGCILPEYLLAFFKTRQFLNSGEQVMSGAVGQQRVPKQYVVDCDLPLPPIQEQRRIVDKLDALFRRVDMCSEHLGRIPEFLQHFRQAVLSGAISGKLTEEWRAQHYGPGNHREVRLDDANISVPAAWGDSTVAGVVEPTRPLCSGVVQPGANSEHGVPLIRVQDLRHGTVNVEQLRTVSPAIDQQYRRSRVIANDILVSVVGTIGRTAIVPPGVTANIARAIARISCRSTVSPKWVHIWLSSTEIQWWLLKSSREVARKTLNLGELGATPIAIPNEDEQQEIIRRVEVLFSYADALENNYVIAHDQLGRLTPSLLAKAFRGELVPQDPTEEPATALLDRVPQRLTKRI
jgi:type I restriction enzyme S subunit